MLDPPTILSATSLSDTSILIDWINNENHTKEFVISRKSNTGSFHTIGIISYKFTMFTDTLCVLGSPYIYAVQSKVESNLSTSSNTLTTATEFPAPSHLLATITSDSEVQLSWTDNTAYEAGFKIERDSGSGFTEIGTVAANITDYTDTGLILGVNYIYRVAGFTSSSMSTWISITTATEFPAPSHLLATITSDSEVQLSWTDNTAYEAGFKIERDSGSGFTEIGTVAANITDYTDTGLILGVNYIYRVAGFTVNNISNYSAPASGTAPVVDYDGNIYKTIQIGDQLWMAKNLVVTHYRDGTPIPKVQDNFTWVGLSTGAYSIYNDSEIHAERYGYDYNWYAVTDIHQIAPEGWHVPTDGEWKELEMYLGMTQSSADVIGPRGNNEGSKLADSAELWNSGALENDSEFGSTGFAALPGGFRNHYGAVHTVPGYSVYFWAITESSSSDAWYRKLDYHYSGIFRHHDGKGSGFSVRCVKD